MLLNENKKSLTARYGDPYEPEELRYHVTHADLVPVEAIQVIKACDCYEYQACEHKEWPTSEAKAFIGALRAMAWHALPGYDDAQWEL